MGEDYIDEGQTPQYGPLDKHAPQIVFVTTGVVLGLLANLGIALNDTNEAAVTQVIALVAPPLLAWIAGKITELFTFSKRTVDRHTR